MNDVRATRPTPRIQVLTPTTATVHWEMAVLMVLGLFGLTMQPARR